MIARPSGLTAGGRVGNVLVGSKGGVNQQPRILTFRLSSFSNDGSQL